MATDKDHNKVSNTLVRTKEIVVPVRYRITYLKGNREAVKAMIQPGERRSGWSDKVGDYSIEALGVEGQDGQE